MLILYVILFNMGVQRCVLLKWKTQYALLAFTNVVILPIFSLTLDFVTSSVWIQISTQGKLGCLKPFSGALGF